jgi:outer membrane protein OmpA-like peptidoglycan-associated protein
MSLQQAIRILPCLALVLLPTLLPAQTPPEELQRALQMLDQGESVEHLVLNLGDINFATGKAALGSQGKAYLDQIARLLKAAPNMELMIRGYADNTGSAATNEQLSVSRAINVRNYLIGKGIAEKRLQARGLGSSNPIADNSTPEGRAKNRRVEMEILRNETVQTVQDIIVLRDGQRIGAMVQSYDAQQVAYRQFSSADEQQIATGQVEKIIFADGREVHFDQPLPEAHPPAAPSPAAPQRRSSFRPFATAEAFHQGQFVIGGGLGLGSNIGIGYRDHRVSLPPVWMVLELPIGHNLGLSLAGGAMRWSPKESEDATFSYYTLAPRLAYHLNLGSTIDLYAGAAINGRLVTLEVERLDGEPLTDSNHKIDASLFVGLRYYLNNTLGIYGEYGGDGPACAKFGLALRLGQ